MEIIRLVKQHEPITGDQIAEMLGLSRPTIRSDFSLLVMLGFLDAKPKVGYFLGKSVSDGNPISRRLLGMKVKEAQSVAVNVRETTSVHDAVVTLFLEDVGSLIVTDEDGMLVGMLSRKDLLKFALGNANASATPVSLVMTRQPNIITVSPDESILEAARRMIDHQVDSLPVVVATAKDASKLKQEVVGRITKTTMTRMLIDLAVDSVHFSGQGE